MQNNSTHFNLTPGLLIRAKSSFMIFICRLKEPCADTILFFYITNVLPERNDYFGTNKLFNRSIYRRKRNKRFVVINEVWDLRIKIEPLKQYLFFNATRDWKLFSNISINFLDFLPANVTLWINFGLFFTVWHDETQKNIMITFT